MTLTLAALFGVLSRWLALFAINDNLVNPCPRYAADNIYTIATIGIPVISNTSVTACCHSPRKRRGDFDRFSVFHTEYELRLAMPHRVTSIRGSILSESITPLIGRRRRHGAGDYWRRGDGISLGRTFLLETFLHRFSFSLRAMHCTLYRHRT